MEAQERVLGAEHPDTLFTTDSMASLLEEMERYEEAEEYYLKELKGCEKSLGPEASDTLLSLQNFTVFLRNHEKYLEAEKYYALLLERRERANGLIHSGTGSSWFSYAKFQSAKGDLTQAEKACRKALDIRSQLEEPDYEDIGNTQLLLAQILLNTNQKKEALKMAKAAKEKLQENGGRGLGCGG